MIYENRKRYMILMVIVLGSLLGLSEVVLGDFLADADFSARSGILTGIVFMVAAFGLAVYRSPLILIGIAGVAVLCKQMVVPVLGVSVMCKANSCMALFLQLGVLSAAAGLFMDKLQRNTKERMAVAASGAFSASMMFFFIGMRLAPCKYLLSYNSLAGFGLYSMIEGLSWAFFSAMLFPAGWRLGELFSVKIYPFLVRRPLLAYYGSSVVTVLSWSFCLIAITSGI